MKLRKLISLPILCIAISSCEDTTKYAKPLIFTEFYAGEAFNDRAFEICNISSTSIDLSNYKVNIYRYGESPSETIELEGTLEPNKTFVVCFSEANDDLKKFSDMSSEYLLNLGGFSMSINDKKGHVVDVLGSLGVNYDFSIRSDLVRKKEFYNPHDEYVPYEWIRFLNNSYMNLGSSSCINEEELLKGPRLSENDLNTPFCENSSIGSGGAMEVSLAYLIDGDTTRLNFGTKYEEFGVSGSESVRYFGINTPEVAHTGRSEADPYGNEAKEFTNSLLRKAKHIIVQSINGYALRETYGRLLGYVWITDKESPKIEDYELLSYLVVKEGLARTGFVDRYDAYVRLMAYNNITYIDYIEDAEHYAEVLKLNIFSK